MPADAFLAREAVKKAHLHGAAVQAALIGAALDLKGAAGMRTRGPGEPFPAADDPAWLANAESAISQAAAECAELADSITVAEVLIGELRDERTARHAAS